MKFGLLLDPPGKADWQARFATIRGLANAADKSGFEVVVAPQHVGDPEYRLLEPISLLSRLSAEVSIRLATGVVIAPLVPPPLLAEQIATLDVVSSGRCILGLGAGHRKAELATFGIVREERGERLERCVSAVKEHWLAGRGMRPVQFPHPPIWIAATSDRGVGRAARLGDAWYVNPGASTSEIVRQLRFYEEVRAELGLPQATEVPMRRDIYLTQTERDRSRLQQVIHERDKRQLNSGFAMELPTADRRRRTDRMERGSIGDALGSEVIGGSPSECRDQLQQLHQALGRDLLVVLRLAWSHLTGDALIDHFLAVADLCEPLS